VEVLITIFIMSIGMLAILTLFPLGAMSMGRALQDDRVAIAAANAESIALAFDIRRDPQVAPAFTNPGANQLTSFPNDTYPKWAPLPIPGYTGPSYPVFVDLQGLYEGQDKSGRIGFLQGPSATPTTLGIPRRGLSFVNSVEQARRWYTLLDDITFTPKGDPEGSPVVQRLGRYTWAYLLRRPQAFSESVVDLTVVVYGGRVADSSSTGGVGLPTETTYPVTNGAGGTTSLVLVYGGTGQPAAAPATRLGGWILDVTQDAAGVPRGQFYRVTGVTEGTNQVAVEVQTPLLADVNAVVVMQDVVEVLEKGSNWQP